MINTKDIKELAKGVSVLYVEDDVEVRENTLLLLMKFFDSVDTANNGQDGLALYKQKKFDMVISDISMPKMNGIELCQAVKALDFHQHFLVTSAYDESKYLRELIEYGVDQFILKPLSVENFSRTIYRALKVISDRKMSVKYAELLEHTNMELYEANQKLHKINRILTMKVKSQKELCPKQKNEKPIGREDQKKGEENYLEYIEHADVEELGDLEEEIGSIIALMVIKDRFETENITKLSLKLDRMGAMLYAYPIFANLTPHIKNLSATLLEINENDEVLFKKVSLYLESFMFVLTRWKEDVWIKGVENPNIYDISLINDIQMIRDRILGTENDGEIELF